MLFTVFVRQWTTMLITAVVSTVVFWMPQRLLIDSSIRGYSSNWWTAIFQNAFWTFWSPGIRGSNVASNGMATTGHGLMSRQGWGKGVCYLPTCITFMSINWFIYCNQAARAVSSPTSSQQLFSMQMTFASSPPHWKACRNSWTCAATFVVIGIYVSTRKKRRIWSMESHSRLSSLQHSTACRLNGLPRGNILVFL